MQKNYHMNGEIPEIHTRVEIRRRRISTLLKNLIRLFCDFFLQQSPSHAHYIHTLSMDSGQPKKTQPKSITIDHTNQTSTQTTYSLTYLDQLTPIVSRPLFFATSDLHSNLGLCEHVINPNRLWKALAVHHCPVFTYSYRAFHRNSTPKTHRDTPRYEIEISPTLDPNEAILALNTIITNFRAKIPQ